jgi:hypothetical protein
MPYFKSAPTQPYTNNDPVVTGMTFQSITDWIKINWLYVIIAIIVIIVIVYFVKASPAKPAIRSGYY